MSASTTCAGRDAASAGPVDVDPDSPALIGLHLGDHRRPQGRRAHPPHPRLRGAPAGRPPGRARPAGLVGAPVGHAIGMLAGLLCPLVERPPALPDRRLGSADGARAPWSRSRSAAGSGSTYFFTSLLDCPGFGPEHLELMRYIGLGGSPIPDAVAERADRLGISLVRAYGMHRAPLGHRVRSTRRPREKRIHTDGCPLEWVEVRTVDEDGHDVGVGRPGEILTRGPDRFAGYTDPALTAEAVDEDGLVPHRRHRRARRRGLPHHHRPGEGHHHPRRRERERGRGGAAAGPHGGRGRGGGGGGAGRAAGRARVRLLPHAARRRAARPRGAAGRTSHAAGLARQKWPEEIRSSTSCRGRASGKVQKFVLRERLRAGG